MGENGWSHKNILKAIYQNMCVTWDIPFVHLYIMCYHLWTDDDIYTSYTSDRVRNGFSSKSFLYFSLQKMNNQLKWRKRVMICVWWPKCGMLWFLNDWRNSLTSAIIIFMHSCVYFLENVCMCACVWGVTGECWHHLSVEFSSQALLLLTWISCNVSMYKYSYGQ